MNRTNECDQCGLDTRQFHHSGTACKTTRSPRTGLRARSCSRPNHSNHLVNQTGSCDISRHGGKPCLLVLLMPTWLGTQQKLSLLTKFKKTHFCITIPIKGCCSFIYYKVWIYESESVKLMYLDASESFICARTLTVAQI